MKWNPVQESIWLLPSKHSEGPCCFLQCNSTAVTLGGCDTLVSCLPEQLMLPSSVSYSPQRLSAWKRERALTAERMQHFMDLPLKHGGIRLQLWHAYNVQGLQLLCSSLLQEVSSYGKQKAGRVENGSKVYFIPSARSPAKHTTPERSNSCSLLLQDLPSVAWAWRSICSTDN